MIKKIVLGAIMLSPLAMIACSSEQVHNHYPIAHTYRLVDGAESKTIENIEGKYTTVDSINKPDSLELPMSVLFSSKATVLPALSKSLKLIKNGMAVDYSFNEEFKVTTDDPKWIFDGDKLIAHDNKTANITITFKGLTATTQVFYGSLDSVLVNDGEASKWDITKVTTPSVWGTTTTLSKEKTPDGVESLDVHMDDVQESAGGLKGYGYINGMTNLDHPMKLTPYANYIAEKFYITKSLLNTPIWFRTTWTNGDKDHLSNNSIDFSKGGKTFTKEGWYLIQTKIDKSIKWNGEFHLSLLKFVQMATKAPAKSGDLYLQGIYESFDKMTSVGGADAEVINV